MQIDFQKNDTVFNPLDITFTVTTQEEFDKLAAVFNHVAIQDFLNIENVDQEFERLGANPTKYFNQLLDRLRGK